MRTLLKAFLGLVLVVVIIVAAFGGFLVWSLVNAKVDTVGKVDFNRPLFVPPLAESRVDDEGRRVFDLVMQQGASDFGRERPTPTWGFNGDYLGPTCGPSVARRCSSTSPTSSTRRPPCTGTACTCPRRWTAGRTSRSSPGTTWSPTWRVDQPAATLWYHPHPHGETAEHVYRGLAGMFIVDDGEVSGLPDEYGVDDVPVIVQDKKFDGDELDDDPGFFDSTGILGDHGAGQRHSGAVLRGHAPSGSGCACSTLPTPGSTTSGSPTTVRSTWSPRTVACCRSRSERVG